MAILADQHRRLRTAGDEPPPCLTLPGTGEFDPACSQEDAIEAYDALTVPKELWVMENRFCQWIAPRDAMSVQGDVVPLLPLRLWQRSLVGPGDVGYLVTRIASGTGGEDGPFWLGHSGFRTHMRHPLFSRPDTVLRPPHPWSLQEPPRVMRSTATLHPASDRGGHAVQCPEEMGLRGLHCEPHEPPAHSRTPDPGR